jgi:hypothetical protein
LKREQIVFAIDRDDLLFIRDLQIEFIGDLAVIRQRFGARRLVVRRGQRDAADLEQLRRREEDHLGGKAKDRVDQHALLEHLVVQIALLARDGGGQARWAGADDDDVANRHID